MLLSLLGARGLAVGYRKVHCCCSDEGGRMRGDSQLIGSPRLTACLPRPVIAAGKAHRPLATTFRLIAPSLGNAGSEFAIATEHRTAVNHTHRCRRHCSSRRPCVLSQCSVVVDKNRGARSAVQPLGETRAALHHRRFSLPCQRSEPACCSGHCPPLRPQVTTSKQASEAGAAWRCTQALLQHPATPFSMP